jgi:Tfp pilus assembly protein PilX
MPPHFSSRQRPSGFALPVVLILALLVGMLAASSAQDAQIGQLLSSTRTLQQRAFAVAELGLVAAQEAMRPGDSRTAASSQLLHPQTPDRAAISTRLIGTSALPQGFSAGRFVEQHHEAVSVGQSVRHAQITLVQGFSLVVPVPAAAGPPP